MKNITSNYRAGDFLIRVKNIALSGRGELSVQNTKFIEAIAKALKEEGYLQEITAKDGVLNAKLAYSHKEPVLSDLRLVSKPGLRVYKGKDELKGRKKGSSILILSTPKGIMSHKNAIKNNIGGEVIAEVW
jgi:small subunit ribosomal protein S8